MTVSQLLNSVSRTAMLDFYNEFFEPVITRQELDDQITLFNQQVRIASDWIIHIREEEGDIIAKGIATQEDVGSSENIGSLIDFSLDFIPWGQMMSMEVSRGNLDEMDDHAIAALIFEEMVWHGWDEESQIARRDDIDDSIQESLNEMVRTGHLMIDRLSDNAKQAEEQIALGDVVRADHLHGDDLRAFIRSCTSVLDLTGMNDEQLMVALMTRRAGQD